MCGILVDDDLSYSVYQAQEIKSQTVCSIKYYVSWRLMIWMISEEVAKKSKGIKDAEKANVQVVDEGFLDAVKKGGAVLLIQSHNLVSWGSDVSTFKKIYIEILTNTLFLNQSIITTFLYANFFPAI